MEVVELTLIQIVKRAAFRQLQAVSEGHVFVDPADFEFMTGPGLAETAVSSPLVYHLERKLKLCQSL